MDPFQPSVPEKFISSHLAFFPLYFRKNQLRIKIIFAGDDVTDEDAITALKGMAFSFRVVSHHLTKTNADRRLPSTDSVLTLLKWVEKHMNER